jgi:hypothetical protein
MLWYNKLKMVGNIKNSIEAYDTGWRRLDSDL